MEFWEFLIQKEGDRSWLPLESPSVEILEGRYRVVARSNRVGTATEVRVTHYATSETPPVRRVRKRSGLTNPDGLIVILPFTRLQAGVWELHCTGDLMAEMMGENWQYTVQLDVVPIASLADDWEPALPDNAAKAAEPAAVHREGPPVIAGAVITTAIQPPVTPEPEAEVAAIESPVTPEPEVTAAAISEAEISTHASAEDEAEVDEDIDKTKVGPAESATVANPEPLADAVPTTMAEVLQQIEQRSEQLVDSIFQALEFGEETAAPADLAEASKETITSDSSQLQVVLEQETFIMQRNEPLILAGRVESADATQAAEQLTISELRVRLHDPQTSQLLMDEVYPIGDRVPPFPFSGTISLPEHYQTYLLLGELIFQGRTSSAAQQVLATRSFNVTTDLHELIESIANDFPSAPPTEAVMPEIAEPVPPVELNRLHAQALGFQRSSQQPLPPQLRPADSTRTHASLDLPSFTPIHQIEQAASLSVAAADEISAQPDQMAQPDSKEENIPEVISTSATDLLLDPSTPLVIGSDASAITQPALEMNQAATGAPETAVPNAVPEISAKGTDEDGLDLFLDWDDLDSQVPVWQQRQPQRANASDAPEDVSFRALNLKNRFWTRLQALATDPDLSSTIGSANAAETIVDPNVSLTPMTRISETSIQKRQATGFDAELTAHEILVDDDFAPIVSPTEAETIEMPAASGPLLPEDEPIPTPRLQLQNTELTAGQPISLTVKLPNLTARVYVKLWLRDRQTRSLLGTPRWLIDFVPDGFGNQMARTEVIVPPGCLKVQFEAITVEIASQRESDKITMTRPVVPPDLSSFSLDGLEI